MKAKLLLCAMALCAITAGITACDNDEPMKVTYTKPKPYDPRRDDVDPIKNEAIQTKVVAHRGYWQKYGFASQNTVRTFMEADLLNIYGAEFDIHLTSDGVVVASHDPTVTIGGEKLAVNNLSWSELKNTRLDNGELVESLEQFLDNGKNGKIKFIIEFKAQSTDAIEILLADKTLELVKAKNLEARTEYISFEANILKHISTKVPAGTKIQYLCNGYDKAILTSLGATGVDASKGNFTKEQIQAAKSDGFSTNVWTVNDISELKTFVEYGVDLITTDDPWLAIEVIEAAKRGKTLTERLTVINQSIE